MIIARTPFRISFFGGGTDFPEFYREHGGATLATAIDKFCYVSAHKLGPFFSYKMRATYSQTETVRDNGDFQHPLIRESLRQLGVNEGLEIAHVADLPGRTGIGSSSSFTVALLHALHTLRGETVDADTLAQEAIQVERERVKDSGGRQDQYAAAFGGFHRFQFGPGDVVTVKRLAIQPQRKLELNANLLLFFTGTELSAEPILQEQKKRTADNTPTLLEMLGMVNHAEQILLGNGDLREFGALLHESWIRKRSLSSGISNSRIDEAYDAAREAGAVGGKLLGAGGRGFLLLHAEPERHAAIRKRLKTLKEIPFNFCAEGSRIIFQSPEG